jgi:hypothetical protein
MADFIGHADLQFGRNGQLAKVYRIHWAYCPEDKKALYMGTSFLPIAAAHQLAGWLSGGIYERTSDKLFLLKEEVVKRGLSIPEIGDAFSKNDYFTEAAKQMNMSSTDLSGFLWSNYHPAHIWMVYSGIAVAAVFFCSSTIGSFCPEKRISIRNYKQLIAIKPKEPGYILLLPC